MFLKGLYTATITPFLSSGEIDFVGFRENLRFQISHKVDGIVVLGTTGEVPTLTSAEQKELITIAVSEVKGKAHLLVGTGSYCTKTTIEKTKLAKELGADGALIVTPYYNKPMQEGLFLHFKAISEAVSFPICLYNIQGRTGVNIHTETLKRIMSLHGIVAIKEASGNISQISDTVALANECTGAFAVLSGDDAITLPLIALGGHGVISVVSNIFPKKMKQLVDAALNDNLAQAKAIHFELSDFFKAAFIETNPIPIKAAMGLRNYPSGPCRLPLSPINSQNLTYIEHVLHKLSQE